MSYDVFVGCWWQWPKSNVILTMTSFSTMMIRQIANHVLAGTTLALVLVVVLPLVQRGRSTNPSQQATMVIPTSIMEQIEPSFFIRLL
jgi:hypothetical protein